VKHHSNKRPKDGKSPNEKENTQKEPAMGVSAQSSAPKVKKGRVEPGRRYMGEKGDGARRLNNPATEREVGSERAEIQMW